ncbi:MAG: hypothetical protein M1319_05825 [Chloroflexi bacterium]|nr:hypothetical protein [Chloroflexota bacterium]
MDSREVSLWVYPWDIKADGIEETVGRCKEEFGLTSISLTCSYHSGKFLLPHRDSVKVYLPEPGSVYFTPDLSLYTGTKLKPRVSSLVAEGDVLEQTAAACAKHGLGLRAWTVATHGSYHGTQHPECLQVNAFGDRYPFTVCPSNPDVRGYVIALVNDLVSRGCFLAIDLESPGFAPFTHGHHHELTGVSHGPFEDLLMSLCFCDRCLKRAQEDGIDAEKLRADVSSILLKRFNSDTYWPEPARDNLDELCSLVISRPDLYQFLRLRSETVTSLVGDVKKQAIGDSGVRLAVTAATFSKPVANAWIEGEDLKTLAGVVDEVIALAYFKEIEKVMADVDFCTTLVGDPGKIVLGQSLLVQGATSLDNALAKIRATLDRGISKYSFYNYGFIGEGRRSWLGPISQAIRGAN